ncbi:MAG: hypothetical protein WBF00_14340 [Methylocella sp.]
MRIDETVEALLAEGSALVDFVTAVSLFGIPPFKVATALAVAK